MNEWILIFIRWNRSLQYASSKLKCLEILHQLCSHLVDEIILEKILPYIRVVQISPTFEFQRSRGLKLIE